MNPDNDIAIKLNIERADFCFNVDVKIPAQGVTAIFGPSGSGKTTLLRCIAGLERAQGDLSVAGKTWQSDSIFLPAHKRAISYVFQEASLLPHLTVAKNLKYASDRALAATPEGEKHSLLKTLGIDHLLQRMPHTLSGGEQQRVAIARALLRKPDILLMDEPLASLDQARKQEILPWLETLGQYGIPILYVSHSIAEIARIADRVIAIRDGKVITEGLLNQALSNPDFPFPQTQEAAVVIEGNVSQREEQWQLSAIKPDGYDGQVWVNNSHGHIGDRARIHILAADVSVSRTPATDSSIQNILPCRIASIQADNQSAMALLCLQLGQQQMLARTTRRAVHQLQLQQGDQVWAQIKSASLI